MEFQDYWRKRMSKFQGSIKKVEKFPGALKKKILLNVHGYWFLTLEFPRGVTKICRISGDESFFSPEYLRIKWQIYKLQGGRGRKVYLKPPSHLWIFSGITQLTKSQLTAEMMIILCLSNWIIEFKSFQIYWD